MRTLTFTAFPEVSTSLLRELQWACDWWKRQYAETGYQSVIAWELYGNAIDNEEPQAEIESLFEVATMFDNIRKDAWRKWDEAKAQYLAMMN